MRIIAGQYRGRTIKSLPGTTTRPTTDRVREALMSALISARGGFDGALVLDAFAGSGALGIEALSRGAQSTTFYECDAKAFRVLRQNLLTLEVPFSRYSLFHGDCIKQRPRFADKPFDVVFFDPPYSFDVKEIAELIRVLVSDNVISSNALISYEHAKSADSQLLDALGSLQCELISHKKYGDTSIEIIRLNEENRSSS